MLKKEIKYTDYNGNERIEDFYFNLNTTELAELEIKTPGGMDNYIKKIRNAANISEIYDFFMTIIEKSYGEKSDDGRAFKKSKEIFENFKYSAAFDPFLMEFYENPPAFADFIVGIYPSMTAEGKKALEAEKEKMIQDMNKMKEQAQDVSN